MSGDQAIENLEAVISEPLEQKESVQFFENLNKPTNKTNIIITANGHQIQSNLNPNAVEFYPSYLKKKPETQAKEQIKKLIFKDSNDNIGNCEAKLVSCEMLCENSDLKKQEHLMKTAYNSNEIPNNVESIQQPFTNSPTIELDKHFESNAIGSFEMNLNETLTIKNETKLSLTNPIELEKPNVKEIALVNSKPKSMENLNNKTIIKQNLTQANFHIEKPKITKQASKIDANNIKCHALNNIKAKQNDRIEATKLKTCKEIDNLKGNTKVNSKMSITTSNETAKNKSKPATKSTATEVVKQNLIKAVEKLKSNIKVKSKINANDATKKKTDTEQKSTPSNTEVEKSNAIKTVCKDTDKIKSNVKMNSKINSNESIKTDAPRTSLTTSTTNAVQRNALSSTKKSSTVSSMSGSKNLRSSKINTSKATSDNHEPCIKSAILNSRLERTKNKDSASQKSFNMEKDKTSLPSRSSIRSSSCNVKPSTNHKKIAGDHESLLKKQAAKTPRSTVASNLRKSETQKVS